MGSLFENAGAKIRSYATGLFAVCLAIAIISAFGTFIVCCVELGILGVFLGIFLMVIEFALSVFSAYIFCLFVAAFGDLVQNTAMNAETNNLILAVIKNRSATVTNNAPAQQKTAVPHSPVKAAPPEPKADVKDQPSPAAENIINDTYWICGNCHTKNLNSRVDCWACGQKKE